MDKCPHCGGSLLKEWHDFKAGDRVRHTVTRVPDTGTVERIADDGAVMVLFDGESHPRSKKWRGEYCRSWFERHPNGLMHVEDLPSAQSVE